MTNFIEKFLKEEINKLLKENIEIFPKSKADITDDKIEIILQEILKKGTKWKNKNKKNWRNNLINQEENWEFNKKQNLISIKKLLEKFFDLKNKQIDKEEIKNTIKKILVKNENKRVRTSDIENEFKQLIHNQYNDYNRVPSRQKVYTCISELREKYREENYENGYIISGEILDKGNNRVDGWLFTKNKKLILNYFDKEIAKHNKALKSFSALKKNLENL